MKMWRDKTKVLVCFGFLVMGTGCSGAGTGEGESSETTQEALTGEYSYSLGSTTTMIPASQGFCFLTKFTGTMRSLDDYVGLDIDSSGRWVINGRSTQNFLAAKARCVNWNAFNVGGVPAVTGSVSFGTSSASYREPRGFGRSYCYLAGVGGDFHYGAGENVIVYPGGSTGWVQENHWESGAGVFSRIACVTLKDASNQILAFPLGPRYSVAQAEYTHTDSHYNSTPALAPGDAGICALARVAGRFDGGAENVNVAYSSSSWTLEANAARGIETQGGSRQIRGDAQCGYYR